MTWTPSTIKERLASLGAELTSLPAQIEAAEQAESAARRTLKDAELAVKDRENEIAFTADGANDRERKAAALKTAQGDEQLMALERIATERREALDSAAATHSRVKAAKDVALMKGRLLVELSAWERQTAAQDFYMTTGGAVGDSSSRPAF